MIKHVLESAMLASTVFLFCSGCAFGSRNISLMPVSDLDLQSGIADGKTVQVGRPADYRTGPPFSVGCVRNGYKMRTAEVIAVCNIPEWIQDQICNAFSRCGYKVSKNDKAEKTGQEESDVTISLSLYKFFCDSYYVYDANVELGVEIRINGSVRHNGKYYGSVRNINWAATPSGYAETLRAAMRDCLQKMIPCLQGIIENSDPAIHETRK